MLNNFFEMMSWFFGRIKSVFITGFLTLLPLSLTAILISFAYSTFHAYFSAFSIPAVILTMLIVGFFVEYIITEAVIRPIEKLINKIPFIGAFYSGIRSLSNFFAQKRFEDHKRQVVLIEYPKKGTYHLALLVGGTESNFSKLLPEASNKEMVRVFMPMTHFTMGYFLILPKNEIIETDITFSEAVKSIVSGGLITPESLEELDQISEKK